MYKIYKSYTKVVIVLLALKLHNNVGKLAQPSLDDDLAGCTIVLLQPATPAATEAGDVQPRPLLLGSLLSTKPSDHRTTN